MQKVAVQNIKLKNDRWLWQAAIFCFMLASITGVVYRLGMIGWLPGNLNLQNVRHAHSHLMFFGWAVPLPLYILLRKMSEQVEGENNGIKTMRWAVFGGLIFGLISYPLFLVYGYRPVASGGASLPLSVICSGLVMITWYIYTGGYLAVRSKVRTDASTPWFEAALVMLTVSSLGAWGVALVQAIDPQNQLLMKGMTHFFLSGFTEGWVVLAVMAILYQKYSLIETEVPISAGLSIGLIALGAPLTFPYGISESLLSSSMLTTARIGGIMISAGLLLAVYRLLKVGNWKKTIWIWPLALILVKGLMQLTASVIPSGSWLSDHALRIFYLHVLLLGAYTLVGMAWLGDKAKLKRKYFYLVLLSVLTVLFSLILMTRFLPVYLGGAWIFYFTTVVAILPAVSITIAWFKLATIPVRKEYEGYK